MLITLLALAQAPLAAPELRDFDQLPVKVVTEDDTAITESCRIVIPEGLVIRDANGDGVLHIESDGIAVVFAAGSVLLGAPSDRPLDQLKGTGIAVRHHKHVILSGLRVEGFHNGLVAEECEWLRLEDSSFERHYAARLGSTPQLEDSSDWLWPHANDEGEWLANYGASVSIARSSHVTLDGVTCRKAQNGILFDRVASSTVASCDASYLSGWGLGMWRSSDNRVLSNLFDYNVRGYSHGVYNRGQDSAGILAFEQCSRNQFIGNSATHCGDGFFGFSGKEALGEVGEHEPDWYTRRGNNANVFEGNDFSYAAAHGLELTFGFGNIIRRNVFRGNAICGIWGGYSQDTEIEDNLFARNGDAGYGVERGGINIDHARGTLIRGNRFGMNACGVHLWSKAGDFESTPWGRAQNLEATGNRLEANVFVGDELAVELRGRVQAVSAGNTYIDVGDELKLDPESDLEVFAVGADQESADPRPGRESILMTEWGPWDGQTPFARLESSGERGDVWRLYGFDEKPKVTSMLLGRCRPRWLSSAPDPALGGLGSWQVRIEPQNPDASAASLWPYAFGIAGGEGTEEVWLRGLLQELRWTVAHFASPVDPREDLDTWRAAAERAPAELHMGRLRYAFANAGPAGLFMDDGSPRTDHFGTRATTMLTVPSGSWRVTTRSDDGVRVLARESGKDEVVWIENWTHHGPTEDSTVVRFEEPTRLTLTVEHFELDGYAWLELDFERLP